MSRAAFDGVVEWEIPGVVGAIAIILGVREAFPLASVKCRTLADAQGQPLTP